MNKEVVKQEISFYLQQHIAEMFTSQSSFTQKYSLAGYGLQKTIIILQLYVYKLEF